MGYTLINTTGDDGKEDMGEAVGEIVDADDSTENVLLTLDNGQLIPAAYDLIVNIDHTRRLLIMQLPEGLLQI